MMFSRTIPHAAEEEEKKDIFAPVADLMVGVVFIFIILMMALVLNLRTEEKVPRSQLEAEKKISADLRSRVDQLEPEVARLRRENEKLREFARFVRESNVQRILSQLSTTDDARFRLLEQIRSKLADADIEVTVNPAAGTLMLPAGKLFNQGQAAPTPDGSRTILKLGDILAEVLPCYGRGASREAAVCAATNDASQLNAVYIEGHTDVDPINPGGKYADNWDLSAARAISAYRLIRDHNDSLSKLLNNKGEALLGVSGYAETRPANREAGDRKVVAVKDKDRRIEIRVVMTANTDLVSSILEQLNARIGEIDDLIP